ncbi:MAG: hypothetical protein PH343_03230 [Nitrospira sp.]|nr:hypothetical protein [Nitrospira sp.]
MVGGFTIVGIQSKTVLIRGRGPSMSGAPYNFTGTLSDPLLEVYCGPTLFAKVDNWQDGPIQCDPPAISCSIPPPSNDPCQPNIGQTSPPPGCMQEAALIITLPPQPACGNYTAKLKGVNNTTGIGIFEVYELSP